MRSLVEDIIYVCARVCVYAWLRKTLKKCSVSIVCCEVHIYTLLTWIVDKYHLPYATQHSINKCAECSDGALNLSNSI